MFERLKRIPPVQHSTAGPFHLIYLRADGGYRDQKTIAALKRKLYLELLNRHRIICFDSVTVYRQHADGSNGETWACMWVRDNSLGTAGANDYLSRSLGADTIPLENTFERDWARVHAERSLNTVVIPEQPVFEIAVRYRGEPTASRWASRVLPHLEHAVREHGRRVEPILEVTDSLYKSVRYLMERVPN